MHDETVAIHGGYTPDMTRAVAVPIYQTIAHQFDDAAHAGAVFDLDIPGFHYNRLNNPTNDVLERRLATLEGGTGAVVVASGAAAVNYSILNLAAMNDNIVTAPQLYGSTYTLFAHVLASQGIEVRFATDDRPECIEPLIDDATKAIFCESVGNPALNVVDLEAVSELAHRHGVPLIVDNTIATPMYLKPIEHGADVVVHSLTKFIGGHGSSVGGVIVDGGKFDYVKSGRFPSFTEPDPSYHGVVYSQLPEALRPAQYIWKARLQYLRDTGPAIAPLNSFLFLQGLETLSVRMERHVANSLAVAKWLEARDEVAWVNYPGLESSPWHARQLKYLPKGGGAVITFGIKGGGEAGRRFIEGLELFSHLANIGDVRSLAIHPASTTHSQLTEAEQVSSGVTSDLIRLSIGIETLKDILADLDTGFAAAKGV